MDFQAFFYYFKWLQGSPHDDETLGRGTPQKSSVYIPS